MGKQKAHCKKHQDKLRFPRLRFVEPAAISVNILEPGDAYRRLFYDWQI